MITLYNMSIITSNFRTLFLMYIHHNGFQTNKQAFKIYPKHTTFSSEHFFILSHTIYTSISKEMNVMDYDKALYYTHRSQWDNLLILMTRTDDDFLSKKIEQFLHAYNFSKDYILVQQHFVSLVRYIDHAIHIDEDAYTLEEIPGLIELE